MAASANEQHEHRSLTKSERANRCRGDIAQRLSAEAERIPFLMGGHLYTVRLPTKGFFPCSGDELGQAAVDGVISADVACAVATETMVTVNLGYRR